MDEGDEGVEASCLSPEGAAEFEGFESREVGWRVGIVAEDEDSKLGVTS